MGLEYGSKEKIPFWKQYLLSINEAAEYFNIGKDKIRKIISENKDADFVLWKWTRAHNKLNKSENYIDTLNAI